MPQKVKMIVGIVAVIGIIIGIMVLAYQAAKKGATGPEKEKPTPPPEQAEIAKSAKSGRFHLGEFVTNTRDEDLHYIKIEVELEYMGDLEKELDSRRGELKDAITAILTKATVQRLKEDYIDHFLHKEIEKKMNDVLGKATSESRIIRVFIPVFLIN